MGGLALFGVLAMGIIALFAAFGAYATIRVVERVSKRSLALSAGVGAMCWAVAASGLLTLAIRQAAAPKPQFPHESELLTGLIVPLVCIVGPIGALLGVGLFAIRVRRRSPRSGDQMSKAQPSRPFGSNGASGT